MKTFRPFIFTTIFIFCLVGGFLASKFILIPTFFPATPTPLPEPTTTAFYKQGTILVIHIDNLEKTKPELISVWAVFMSLTDPSSMMVKPLYPSNTPDNEKPSLAETFNLNQDGKPSAEFFKKMQASNFHWDSYLLVDNEAISILANWVTGKMPRLHAVIPTTQDNVKTVLDEENSLVESICTTLSVPESQRGPHPQWKQIIPKNMRTDLFFEDAAVNWERLTLSNPPPHCEVITASK